MEAALDELYGDRLGKGGVQGWFKSCSGAVVAFCRRRCVLDGNWACFVWVYVGTSESYLSMVGEYRLLSNLECVNLDLLWMDKPKKILW